MKYKFFAVSIALIILFPGFLAGGNISNGISHHGDRYSFVHRQVSSEKLQEYRDDIKFKYEKKPGYLDKKVDDFFEWFGEKIKEAANDLEIGDPSLLLDILKYCAIGCFALLLIFLVMKIIGTDILFKSKKVSYTVVDYGQDITAIDFDALIKKHHRQKEYRLVVRLLYLKTLKILSDMKLIEWKIDKTNREYIRECRKSTLVEPFREVTRLFEYFWYGHGIVDDGNMPLIMNKFKKLFDKSEDQS